MPLSGEAFGETHEATFDNEERDIANREDMARKMAQLSEQLDHLDDAEHGFTHEESESEHDYTHEG